MMILHFKDDVQLVTQHKLFYSTSCTTIGHIDSDYSLRRIPGGKSLTSVDIVLKGLLMVV